MTKFLALIFLEATYYFPLDLIIGDKLIGPQRNGTIHNIAGVVPGIRGNALSFNGVDQYVDMGTYLGECIVKPPLCLDGFTWMMWLKIPSASSTEMVVPLSSNYGPGNGNFGLHIRLANAQLEVVLITTGKFIRYASEDFVKDQWFHFAFSWLAPDNCEMYTDGETITKSKTSGSRSPNEANGQFDLGRSVLGDKYAAFSVDDILFWSERKDINFIQSIYESYGY